MSKYVLVTGGAGYIGSHTAVELFHAGFQPILLDNLSNSKVEVLDRIGEIIEKPLHFYLGDVRDGKILRQIFSEHQIDGVIHFAAYKAVGESVEKPLMYFDNNINSLINILRCCEEFHVPNLGARAVRHREPVPARPRRIGRAQEDLAVGQGQGRVRQLTHGVCRHPFVGG